MNDQMTTIATCKSCGASIDLEGLGSFSQYVEHCDPCAEKINEEESEKRKREIEDAIREKYAARAKETWMRVVPKKYRETDIDHPNYPKSLHRYAMKWAMESADEGRRRPWLGIIGLAGQGKTRVMSQVMNQKIKEGLRCEWVNATQFQWCSQNQHDEESGRKARSVLKKYRNCEFLAFDDLGKQKWTDTVESYFWDLIEERYAQCRGLIWTSNSSLENLKRMLTRDRAESIIGRLAEESDVVEL